MNYEEMSDLEINQAVTGLMFDCEDWPMTGCGKYFYHCGVDGAGHFDREVVDYCNNPSDAWPIIYDNHISIINNYGWGACHRRTGIESSMHVNPLRAAMIVFLMMEDAKNAD